MTDATVCPDMSKVVVASEQGRLFVFPAVVEATFDEDQVYISITIFSSNFAKKLDHFQRKHFGMFIRGHSNNT